MAVGWRAVATRGAVTVGGIAMVVAMASACDANGGTVGLDGLSDGEHLLEGHVTRVVDGDTIHVRVGDSDTVVRLLGIDTPEVRRPNTPVQCWGPQASDRAERLMPEGTAVRLRTDPSQDVRDRYGRLLAHVYLGDRDGPDSVNRTMIAEGHARWYVYRNQPTRHADSFRRAQNDARQAGRGLWGPPCNGRTTAPSRTVAAAPPAPRVEGERCDPNYRGACVPPYPPDIDCDAIGVPVQIVGADPHNLDGDGNGRGCERFGT